MRLIVLFILFSFNANAQIIRANGFYRPTAVSDTLLLDSFPNAVAAFSLRKLRTAYTGNAIRVRRDSTGNAEQDIGFLSSGELDTVSLKNFIRNNNGAITTWYDQSGNGFNFTQTTASLQPKIIINNILQKQKTKPSIYFTNDAQPDYLGLSGDGLNISKNINKFMFISTGRCLNSSGQRILYRDEGNGATRVSFDYNTAISNRIRWGGRRLDTDPFTTFNGNSDHNTNFLLNTFTCDYSNRTITIFRNGSQDGQITNFQTAGNTSNTSSTSIRLGYSINSLEGNITEVIIYNTDVLSNRTQIESNLNRYYNIW